MAVSTSFALGLGNNKSVLLNGIRTLSERILELSFYIFLNVRKALFYRLYGHFAFVVNLTYLGLSSYIFAIKRG